MSPAVRGARPSVAVTVAVAVAALAALVAAPARSHATATPPTYVALGDSYAAGPGIPLPDELHGCHRSTNNYPHLLARALGLELRDATCSGATTGAMTKAQAVFPGPAPQPQLDRLDPAVSLVTLQIGGNDIGFSEIVQHCASLLPFGTPCRDRFVAGGRDVLRERIAATASEVDDVLRAVRARAPRARVLVLGYPAILPDAGPGCWPTMPMTPQDVEYLRATHKALNAMLARVAAATKARYVDVYTPSIGRDACQLPLVRWVEPMAPASPAAPVHPNLLGMQAVAGILQHIVRA